jgi:hypothetical protein
LACSDERVELVAPDKIIIEKHRKNPDINPFMYVVIINLLNLIRYER